MMALTRRLGLVVAVVTAAASPRVRAADPPAASPREQAKIHYDAGRKHYNVGEFERAITEWKAGYELHASADFLFNIAQAYRQQKNYERALFFFDAYLREKPGAANRAEVETLRAEVIELDQAERRRTAAPPETPPPSPVEAPVVAPAPVTPVAPSPAPSENRTLKLAGLATGGGGLVLAGLGVFLVMSASSTASDLEAAAERHETWTDELADRDSSARSKAKLGAISIGVGVAAVLAGGGMYLWGSRSSSPTVEVGGASGEASVTMGWVFP